MITIATICAAPSIAGITPPRVHPAKTKQALRSWVYREYPCLAYIIEHETAGTWSPTIYNYGGSGAYGWPQALPGDKMRSAGADWRTNPMTQLRWMIRYTEERYGGQCAAKSFWVRNRWY